MGEKNRSGVRVERRGGRRILVVDFRFRSKEGREARFRRDATIQTMTGARVEAERLKRYALEHGTVDPPPTVPTFESFVREQFVPLVMPGYSPATRERYDRLLFREGVVAGLGRHRLTEIGAREFLAMHASVLERGASPRQHHVLSRVVLKLAVRLGVIARVPELPPAPKQSRKLPAAPPREVVERVLQGSTGWLRYAIALAYFATERNGETRGLRVMDVDFDAGVVNIRQGFSHTTLGDPKYRAQRVVPMHPRLREVLREATRGRKPRDLLLFDGQGSPSRQKLYKAFIALQRRLGIEPTWSFHQLRHAFGTHAVSGGANIEAVRELMGHKDLTTTTRYIHAVARDKVAVIQALDGQVAGNEKAFSPLPG